MTYTSLLLDAGNTRLKWCIRVADRTVASGVATHTDLPPELDHAVRRWLPAEVRFSCVAKRSALTPLFARLGYLGIAKVGIARSPVSDKGLANAYDDPSQLGVDRWLAALAATRHIAAPCLVIDAGTALTVDFVSRDGRFLGGYIVPGLNTMLAALGRATANIRVDQLPVAYASVPSRTVDAVGYGVVEAALGLIDRARARLTRDSSEAPAIVMTGGDATILHRSVQGALLRRHLVLEGLAIASESTFEHVGLEASTR